MQDCHGGGILYASSDDAELIGRYDSEIITSVDKAKQFLPCDLEDTDNLAL